MPASEVAGGPDPLRSFGVFARSIKLAHSVFALPFALASAALAGREHGITWTQVALIVVAMVCARSAAMGFNRIVDRDFDARNPRTASREIPAGQLTVVAAWAWTLIFALAFVAVSFALSPLCGALSPIALGVVGLYSLTKRFTALCHLVLGLALGLAPVAAWIAVAGSVSLVPLVLAGVVLTWVAGFDIIYAGQDLGFDRSAGLHSVPAAFGMRAALAVSAALHAVTVALLVALPLVTPLAWPWWLGVTLMASILVWEHRLVTPDDLSKVDKAFFDLNGYVALAFLATTLLAL